MRFINCAETLATLIIEIYTFKKPQKIVGGELSSRPVNSLFKIPPCAINCSLWSWRTDRNTWLRPWKAVAMLVQGCFNFQDVGLTLTYHWPSVGNVEWPPAEILTTNVWWSIAREFAWNRGEMNKVDRQAWTALFVHTADLLRPRAHQITNTESTRIFASIIILTYKPLSVTPWLFVVCFISRLNHSYLQWNECLNMKILKCFFFVKFKEMWVIFTPLEVVGRSSETQLQVGEHLNYLI